MLIVKPVEHRHREPRAALESVTGKQTLMTQDVTYRKSVSAVTVI